MNIVDRYANSRFGSPRLRPSVWSQRRPIYDSLTPSEQLEWRTFRARRQAAVFVAVAGVLIGPIPAVIAILLPGDRVPTWLIGLAVGIMFVAVLFGGLAESRILKATRRRFAAQLATLPKAQVPDGLSRRTRFFWRIGSYMASAWVWPFGAKGRYAASYGRLSKHHRDLLMIAATRWHIVGLSAPAIPLALVATFAMPHVPYTLGLFLPFLVAIPTFLAMEMLWLWRRRVLAERFAS